LRDEVFPPPKKKEKKIGNRGGTPSSGFRENEKWDWRALLFSPLGGGEKLIHLKKRKKRGGR